VDKERSAVFIFPLTEDLLEFHFDLWQVFGDAFAHFLFSQQPGWIASLSLLSHQTTCILGRGGKIIAVLDERAVLVNLLENWSTLIFERFKSRNLGFVSGKQCIRVYI
jgi:hypothetical protein